MTCPDANSAGAENRLDTISQTHRLPGRERLGGRVGSRMRIHTQSVGLNDGPGETHPCFLRTDFKLGGVHFQRDGILSLIILNQ